MLSQQRHSSQSPAESVQAESVRTEPDDNKTKDESHHSSSAEEEDTLQTSSIVPKNDIVSQRSKSSSISGSSVSSARKSIPTLINAVKKITPVEFKPSTVKYNTSQEKNKTIKQPSQDLLIRSLEKKSTPVIRERPDVRDIENEALELISIAKGRNKKERLSIFEKVDIHDGHVTYLGTGTPSLLEHCLNGCLSRHQHHKNDIIHSIRHGYLSKRTTCASILEDYSYDGIISPHHHLTRSHSYNHYYNNNHHRHSRSHNDFCYRKRSPEELSLCEIRQVNDTLAKYGIPVFSHQANPYNYHPQQRNIGDIISACQLLINDPTLAARTNEHTALQHVWNAASHYSPTPTVPGYASSSLRGVASHLFNPASQPPYNPASQPPYNPASQPPYNPASQPPYNPAQSVISRLFSGQQPPTQQHNASPFSTPFHSNAANYSHAY